MAEETNIQIKFKFIYFYRLQGVFWKSHEFQEASKFKIFIELCFTNLEFYEYFIQTLCRKNYFA